MSKVVAAAGSNIFGQWFNGDLLISEFQDVRLKNPLLLPDFKLCYSAWSYNIIHQGGNFYIMGAWLGIENSFVKIDLPPEITDTDLMLLGDDTSIVLIHKTTLKSWLFKYKDTDIPNFTWDWTLLPPMDTVRHLDDRKSKRKPRSLIKAVMCNHLVYCLLSDGALYEMPAVMDTSNVSGKIIDIDGGYEHVIILTDSGHVYTWGNGRRCQLGHGSLSNLETPMEVEALGGLNIVKVKAGGWHCLALADTGDVYAWGWNDSGQLGIQKQSKNRLVGTVSHPLPYLVDLYDNSGQTIEVNIVDIACGSRHSAILIENNTVWTAGLNQSCQLGIDGLTQLDRFKKSYECSGRVGLVCGPWCTVVVEL